MRRDQGPSGVDGQFDLHAKSSEGEVSQRLERGCHAMHHRAPVVVDCDYICDILLGIAVGTVGDNPIGMRGAEYRVLMHVLASFDPHRRGYVGPRHGPDFHLRKASPRNPS